MFAVFTVDFFLKRRHVSIQDFDDKTKASWKEELNRGNYFLRNLSHTFLPECCFDKDV